MRKRLTNGLATTVWLGVALAATLLAAAWLPGNLRADTTVEKLANAVAFSGAVLGFHLGLAAAGGMLVASLLRRWRLATAAGVVAIAGVLPAAVTSLPKSPPPVAGPTLRVQSLNALGGNREWDRLLAAIEAADADVLVVQEWDRAHDEALVGPLAALAARFPHSLRYADGLTRGMASFSRTRILAHTPAGVDHTVGENDLRLQRVEIEHAGRRVAVYNVHPASPGRPGKFAWSQRQAADLADLLAEEPLPHVVAGDFNAPPRSANLAALRGLGLREAHDQAGRGRGATWPKLHTWSLRHRVVRRLPGVRIDHVFFSPPFAATSAAVGDYHGSDHLSVTATLAFRDRHAPG